MRPEPQKVTRGHLFQFVFQSVCPGFKNQVVPERSLPRPYSIADC